MFREDTGHGFSGRPRHAGPDLQRSRFLICAGKRPREAQSAGLSEDQTCLHYSTYLSLNLHNSVHHISEPVVQRVSRGWKPNCQWRSKLLNLGRRELECFFAFFGRICFGWCIVYCKWIFAIKNDELGKLLRYEERLVARGFTQEYLMDNN